MIGLFFPMNITFIYIPKDKDKKTPKELPEFLRVTLSTQFLRT